MTDIVNLQISQDLIKPIIESKIKSALVEALGDEKTIIKDMIDVYLHQKVSSNGNVSSYSSDNKYQLVDILLTKLVTEAVKESMVDWLKDKKDLLKLELSKYFETQKGKKELIKSYADGLLNSMDKDYRFVVHFNSYNKEENS